MFSFFERRVPPYPAQEPQVPPVGFFAFVWACTRGMRGWIGLMTLTSALLAAYEAVLFAIMSRVVDWLSAAAPADFLAEQRGTLIYASAGHFDVNRLTPEGRERYEEYIEFLADKFTK